MTALPTTKGAQAVKLLSTDAAAKLANRKRLEVEIHLRGPLENCLYFICVLLMGEFNGATDSF
jgi:hypothetical protein